MDTDVAARDAAEVLGAPASTVLRWCRTGGCEARKDGRGRWVLPIGSVERLVDTHGAAPLPRPLDLTRAQALVLAALVNAPRGLPSARTIALTVRMSPTTVSKVLRNLSGGSLAVQRTQIRLWRGSAVERTLWYANLDHDDIGRLLPYLHTVVLPVPPQTLSAALPKSIWHLFWNADPRDVDPIADAPLVAHRAMVTNDPESLGWGVVALPTAGWAEALQFRNVLPDNAAWLRASRTARTPHVAAT